MAAKKGFKEWLRKKIVGIKRNPQRIGLVAFAITFLYYSLNLTCISNTTAKIQGSGMGLSGFVTMLFSMRSISLETSSSISNTPTTPSWPLMKDITLSTTLMICEFM